MMIKTDQDIITLRDLFSGRFSVSPSSVLPLSGAGSDRRYYRLSSETASVIGTVGTSLRENKAFLGIARHLRAKGIAVPEIYAVSEDGLAYLQEDLGNLSLFSLLPVSTGLPLSGELKSLLLRIVGSLPKIQFEGGDGLDYSLCYPQESFDGRMIMFDLNYFKYCFLKPSALEFDEIVLQEDFERLRDDLLEGGSDCGTFMFRDFQSRNVMIKDGEPYYIDFQGGRRGPIYYDLASFLWQARAAYPSELRSELAAHYLESVRKYVPDLSGTLFAERLRLFVLYRLLQVLGAYGFRGLVEGKPHFVLSIAPAMSSVRELLKTPFARYPYLCECLERLAEMKWEQSSDRQGLTVDLWSFSYKRGIPRDFSGNGGGYMFDCRSTHNPGKYDEYKALTGRDEPVVRFLEEDGEILEFLGNVRPIVEHHVRRFLERGFSHLQVCFGCTGGRHRSVYCADRVARHLSEEFPSVKVVLHHRERGIEEVLGPKA